MEIAELIITEKPSVARDVVAALGLGVLNKGSTGSDGYFLLEGGIVVAPFIGHMLEAVKPAAYFPDGKEPADVFPHLPILPDELKLEPKGDIKDGKVRMKDGKPVPPAQYGILKRLMKSAKAIVNAGDIDREGQLIVDEFLEHCGIDPLGRQKTIQRVALTSNVPRDIVAAFSRRESNGDPKWVNRRLAANTRQIIDWWTGMNTSMAYQRVSGYRQTSVGRVQTPTLALVVWRDMAHESHVPKKFYVPVITLRDGTKMRWHKREDCEGKPGFDEKGRIIDRQVAESIVRSIQSGLSGTISVADRVNKKETPPLPFSLAELQSVCGRRYGLSLKETSDAAQSLYQTKKMITYVGTDCRFLPESLYERGRDTLAAISKVNQKLAAGANPALKSKAWDDRKCDEHFAIVPTGEIQAGLSAAEASVFDAVVRRYAAQFYPAFEYVQTSLAAMFGQDEFRASSREVLRNGWKDAEGVGLQGPADAEAEVEVDDEQESEIVEATLKQQAPRG